MSELVIIDKAFLIAELKNIIASLRSPACEVVDKAGNELVLWQAIHDIAGKEVDLVDRITFERLYVKNFALKHAFMERRRRISRSG